MGELTIADVEESKAGVGDLRAVVVASEVVEPTAGD